MNHASSAASGCARCGGSLSKEVHGLSSTSVSRGSVDVTRFDHKYFSHVQSRAKRLLHVEKLPLPCGLRVGLLMHSIPSAKTERLQVILGTRVCFYQTWDFLRESL